MRTARKSILLVLVLVACATPLWSGEGIWTSAGPPGTRTINTELDRLILDPFSPSTLYLVYFGERGSGVWRTSDAGESWTSINAGISTPYVLSLVPDPFTPGTLYALANFTTGEVIRKSTDGGRTWVEVYNAPAGSGLFFYGMAADPRTPGVLWAWGIESMHRSDDGGVTWNVAARTEFGSAMAFPPGNPDVAYFGGQSSLWRTTDRGLSWQAISSFNDAGFLSLQMAPSRPSMIYARSWDFSLHSCLRSDDAGLTWTPLPLPDAGFACTSILVDGENPLRVWALAQGLNGDFQNFRLYGSHDGGATWSEMSSLPQDLSPYVLLREPASGAFYILGTQGVYREQGGAGWRTMNRGLTQNLLVDFLALPGARTSLLASTTTENNLLRSRNRGRFWRETSLERVTALAFDPRLPFRVVAGNVRGNPQQPGFHESRDGGLHWYPLSDTPDAATSIAFVPAKRQRILIGTANSGIFQSTDGGRTWQRSSAGLPFPDPCDSTFCPNVETWDITVDAHNPEIVHAVFFGNLVRSVNGGWKWSRVRVGEDFAFVTALTQDTRRPTVLYAATQTRLLKSLDGGASWFRVGGDLVPGGQIRDLAFDPREGGILYAATSDRGVLRSRDGGATFEPINLGLPILNVALLEVDPNVPGGLFAATEGAGIWHGSF